MRRLQERLGRGNTLWKWSATGASSFQRSEARRKCAAVGVFHLGYRIVNGISNDPGHRSLFGAVDGVSQAFDQGRREQDGDALIARICSSGHRIEE